MEQKNVLITGASSGIGAATALKFSEQGYRVWGTIRKIERVQELPDDLRKAVRFVAMDVNDDHSVNAGIQNVLSEAGRIDILINNAGYGLYGPIEEMPLDKVRAQLETNLFGTLRVIQAILPGMRERKSGTIVNVSSLAAHFVIPFQTFYSVSKFTIRALTEGLRQELRPFGVRVFAVEPGDIKTKFNEMTQFDLKERSPYKLWFDKVWKTIDKNMQIAPPPEVVAKTIYKAVTKGRRITQRYPTGDFLSCQFPWMSRFLPDFIKEWGIRVFYNI